ncbi:MAG TPA: two-component system activity regulator YycH [Bacillales bacterium]|nr:two-component system activity regulator YycH [Bacillales bacterium]
MSWEGFKSLLLTLLVGLSFVLTWNLWTYQFQYRTTENTEPINSALVEDGKRNVADVVQPIEAVYHKDTKHYGVSIGTGVDKVYEKVRNAVFTNFEPYPQAITNLTIKEKTNWQEPDRDHIALVFPSVIPTNLFGKIVLANLSETRDERKSNIADGPELYFDRMVIYNISKQDASYLKVFFKKGNKTVARARLNRISFGDLSDLFQNSDEYVEVKVDGRELYFPMHPKVAQVSYVRDGQDGGWIPDEDFKRALFTYPDIVDHQGNVYTSNAQVMIVKNHIITLHGTNQPKSNSSKDDQSIIQKSFDYINSHNGWTDDYMLFHMNLSQPEEKVSVAEGKVVYRLLIAMASGKALPVFSGSMIGFDPVTLSVSFVNGDIDEYRRSQINFDKNPLDEKEVELPSGEQVWERLESSDLDLEKLSAVTVGYYMDYPPDAMTIRFSPKWFVRYDGRWQTIDDLLKKNEEQERRGDE